MRRVIPTLLLLALPAVAQAQPTWPTDAQWRVLDCGGVPSFDPRRDQPGATNEQDVVGDTAHPALYIFADTQFLYFRMRIDATPVSGTVFLPSGWGVELDTDGMPSTYELLGEVDGIANPNEVLLGQNTVQQMPNNPADPIENVLTTYPATTNARAVPANGMFASSFGGNPDFFVDWALDLSDLASAGVQTDTPIGLVMGTSTDEVSLNADIACSDGGSGPATLDRAVTDVVRPNGNPVPPPDAGTAASDGGTAASDAGGNGATDGGGNPPPSGTGLRGGPGGRCAIGHGRSNGLGWAFVLSMLSALVLRRRRSAAASRRADAR